MGFTASWGSEYCRAIPENRHNWTEVVYFKQGKGAFCIAGTVYPVREGDVVYIPAGMVHADEAFTPRINGHLQFDPTPTLPEQPHVFHDSDGRFLKLFDLLAGTMLLSDPREQAFSQALVQTLMVLLQSWARDVHMEYSSAVDQINQLILSRFSDRDFNLAAEIEKTGYSLGYFRQLFRRQVGRPPIAQLNFVRLEFAKRQMQIQHEGISVKTISKASGFRDPYYFSRLFKQYEGVSPREYFYSLRKDDKTQSGSIWP